MENRVEALTALAAGSSSQEEFLELAVRALTVGLGYDFASVGELHNDGTCVTTLAAVDGDRLLPPMTYELTGTPCRELYAAVGSNSHLFIERGVTELFPDDADLVKFNAEAYRGELLTDEAGQPFGHVFALHRKAVEDSEDQQAFFRLVSQRIGAELLRWRAVTALKESEARFRDYADCSSDWFWEMGADLRFTHVSPSSAAITGIPTSFIIGKTRLEIAGESTDNEKWRSHLETLEAHRAFREFRFMQVSPDGTLRYLMTSGMPVFDKAGCFTGYRGVGQDLTREMNALQSAEIANSRLELAVDTLSAHIVVFDKNDRLIMCNDAYRDCNNAIREMIVPGTPHEDIIRALVAAGEIEDAVGREEEWIQDRLWRFANPGPPMVRRRRNGDWYRVADARTPDGGTISVGAEISDIKESEVEIEATRQKFEDYASISADWFWEQDENLRFTHVATESAIEMGFGEADITGKTRRETGPEVSEDILQAHEVLLEQQLPFDDFQYSRTFADGRRKYLSISGRPRFDEDGKFLGYRGVGRDITDLVESSTALQGAKERAEKASRAKSEFLAHVSHEFRTPLNAILGFSEMISMQMFGELGDKRYLDYSGDIVSSARHLLSMIEDLIDLTRVESGYYELELEEIQIRSLVDEVAHLIDASSSLNEQTLEIDVLPVDLMITADCRAVKQILINLLSNAAKYNNPGGTIKVRVEVTGTEALITVRDDGPGFDPRLLETVLSPFGRLESPMTRQTEGVGLGLTIVKSLVQLHSGELRIESMPGRGTEVIVSLPTDASIT